MRDLFWSSRPKKYRSEGKQKKRIDDSRRENEAFFPLQLLSLAAYYWKSQSLAILLDDKSHHIKILSTLSVSPPRRSSRCTNLVQASRPGKSPITCSRCTESGVLFYLLFVSVEAAFLAEPMRRSNSPK